MSVVLEFHFNPLRKIISKIKPEEKWSVFDTFCFLPQTLFEKKQGEIYMLGEIKNILPKSDFVLNKTARIIKKYFYQKNLLPSSDSFQLALNKANNFLWQWSQSNNALFTGNFHFAVFAISPNCNMRISKAGDIKIVLFRNNEVFDIGSNFDNSFGNNKIFPDLIEGRLHQKDIVLVATSEVFESFCNEHILEQLAQCQKPSQAKKIFKAKKRIVREFTGACLLVFIKKHPLISLFVAWDNFSAKQKKALLILSLSFFCVIGLFILFVFLR